MHLSPQLDLRSPADTADLDREYAEYIRQAPALAESHIDELLTRLGGRESVKAWREARDGRRGK